MQGMCDPDPVLLRERLRTLREAKNMTRWDLARATVRLGYEGVPVATLVAYEKRPGQVPPADVLEILAEALGESPDVFYEYPLAVAKRDAKLKQSETPGAVAEGAARRREATPPADAPSHPRRGRKGRAA